MTPTLTLRKKLRKVIGQGHPWIFRNALAGPMPKPGRVVTVQDENKRFVARGLAESGPIGVRVFCTQDEPLDNNLFQRRIQAAANLRKRVVPPQTNAFRLLHGEGDRLPGIVCDVYYQHAVLRFDGLAAQTWQAVIVQALTPVLREFSVHHLLLHQGRGDQKSVSALSGQLPQGPVEISEHGMQLKADLVHGQKTGLFLDHRESRYRVRSFAQNADVLNLFGYTGGFSIACGLAGARHVTTVDRAKPACEFAQQSWSDNGLHPAKHTVVATSVQDYLAGIQDKSFDLIICDPPSFAPNEDSVKKAKKAYTAIHKNALAKLTPGGMYLAASCSSHVRRDAFEQTLLDACPKNRCILQVLERWGAPADHPRLAAFPEGDYLTIVLARLIA